MAEPNANPALPQKPVGPLEAEDIVIVDTLYIIVTSPIWISQLAWHWLSAWWSNG